MEKIIEFAGGLMIVTGAVLIVYFIAKYTYLTKKMLAEKGMLGYKSTGLNKLDVAYVSIGVGLGLFLAAGLSKLGIDPETLDMLKWGVVLISGAAGLILASRKKQGAVE